MPLVSTPIQINRLEAFLPGYNLLFSQILIEGFINGFALHFKGTINPNEGINLPFALANSTVVDQKLAKELTAPRILGPFSAPPFRPFQVSPLGLVSKDAG